MTGMSGTDQPEVFNQAFKLKANLALGCLALAALCMLVAIPVLGLALEDRWGVGPTVALAAGLFVVAMVLLLGGGQRLPMVFDERLRRDLAAALTRRIGRNPDDGQAYFVGWTPGPTAPAGGLDMSQDVGFLAMTPDRLVFLGDALSFELPRGQVRWIGPAPHGIPIIMDFGLRVVVYWLDPLGQEQAFTFHRREARWKSQVRRLNEELCEALRQWHQHGIVPAAAGREG